MLAKYGEVSSDLMLWRAIPNEQTHGYGPRPAHTITDGGGVDGDVATTTVEAEDNQGSSIGRNIQNNCSETLCVTEHKPSHATPARHSYFKLR
jgi:hypothetical protein